MAYSKQSANTDAFRGVNPTLERFPHEIKSQQYQVVRIILPEDAENAGIGKSWGSNRTAIQFLGVFSTLAKAEAHASFVRDVQDWANIAVFEMYEWITLPPEKTMTELQTADPGEDGHEIEFVTHDPKLDEYCKALKKTSRDEAMMMKMRVDMAREGKDDAQEISTKEYAEWSKVQKHKQMYDIIQNPEEYTPVMVEQAQLDWNKAPKDIQDRVIEAIQKENFDE